MVRKPWTLRSAFITTTAFFVGSLAGTVTAALAVHFQAASEGLGPATSALVAVWLADKLNALIQDEQS